jgi:4-carboxymuconolactone decarboxylase
LLLLGADKTNREIAMPAEPRIKPSTPAEWTDKAREMFAFFEGPEAYEKGSASNMALTIAHHPKLAFAYMRFGGRLLGAPKLAPRLRELIALYIGWRNQAAYEWEQHVAIGKAAGITDEEFEALKVGPQAPNWSPLDRAVLEATEQLLAQARIDDATWQALSAELDTQQLIELLFVIGNYGMLSWIINAFGIQPESTAAAITTDWSHQIKV